MYVLNTLKFMSYPLEKQRLSYEKGINLDDRLQLDQLQGNELGLGANGRSRRRGGEGRGEERVSGRGGEGVGGKGTSWGEEGGGDPRGGSGPAGLADGGGEGGTCGGGDPGEGGGAQGLGQSDGGSRRSGGLWQQDSCGGPGGLVEGDCRPCGLLDGHRSSGWLSGFNRVNSNSVGPGGLDGSAPAVGVGPTSADCLFGLDLHNFNSLGLGPGSHNAPAGRGSGDRDDLDGGGLLWSHGSGPLTGSGCDSDGLSDTRQLG